MPAKETVDNVASRITDAVIGRVRRSLRSGAFVERTWGQVYGLSRRTDGRLEASVLLAGDTPDNEGSAYGFATVNGILPAVGDTVEVERDDEHNERRIIDVIGQSAYHKLEVDLGNGRLAFGDGTIIPSLFLAESDGRLKTDGFISGVYLSGGAATLPMFTANQDDLAGDASKSMWRIASDTSRNVTGIVAQDGMFVDLINVGNFPVALRHEDSASSAVNRIFIPGATNLTISSGGVVRLWYDIVSARWRVISSIATTAGGSSTKSGSFTANAVIAASSGSDVFNPGSEAGVLESLSATYATARSGGGTINETSTGGQVGQTLSPGGLYYCWEVFLPFPTGSIPDGATITSVTFEVYGWYDHSATPFTLGVYAVDYGATLETSDFVPGATVVTLTRLASISSESITFNGYDTWTNDGSNFLAAINKTGDTRLLIASSRHAGNNTPSGEEYSAFHTNATQPIKMTVGWS